MGRAPCCEKVGLNRGSWTPEEDKRLMAYIYQHGHANWRALPKQAGLLRCGKSCRLRWINYLRPDIKRGNFSREEEETLIKLHASLGNKWSKIASCMPGRTDNEIKNVWNTHLKKKVTSKNSKPEEPECSISSSMPSSISCTIETPVEPINVAASLSSSASSANLLDDMKTDNPLELELLDIQIDEDGSGEAAAATSGSNRGWLEELEKELDMWGPCLVEMEGDPVSAYFQSPFLDCPDAMS